MNHKTSLLLIKKAKTAYAATTAGLCCEQIVRMYGDELQTVSVSVETLMGKKLFCEHYKF